MVTTDSRFVELWNWTCRRRQDKGPRGYPKQFNKNPIIGVDGLQYHNT
jgi:hypothetical protein